ncbi:hypothetical protein HAX54_029417, partial [Datura stramonium]|nr:hypothetical protein [Datura stramonium]
TRGGPIVVAPTTVEVVVGREQAWRFKFGQFSSLRLSHHESLCLPRVVGDPRGDW